MSREENHRRSNPTAHHEYSDPGPGALSEDARFDLLRSERRRSMLRRLDDTDEAVPLSELVAAVVEGESEAPFSPGDHERVALSLEHVHLPKLVATGVIEYDDAAMTAALTDGDDLLFEHLYLSDDR